MHPGSFGGSKMVRFNWLLASQSGCCSFDPSFLKALDTRLRFYYGLNLGKKESCLAFM